MALGNVIAALGDEKQRGAHVNYRSELFVVDKSDALWPRTAKRMYRDTRSSVHSHRSLIPSLRLADFGRALAHLLSFELVEQRIIRSWDIGLF